MAQTNASDSVDEHALRAAFAAELRESTFRTGRVVCAIAMSLYPAWSAFDFLVSPSTAVLRTLAAVMGDTARAEDLVARIGGDELAVLCPQSDLDEATEVALRIAEATARSGTGATLSVGVAAGSGEELTPATLLARADADLYRAKETRDSVWAGGRRREAVAA